MASAVSPPSRAWRRAKGRKPTVAGTRRKVATVLKFQHLRELVDVDVTEIDGRVNLQHCVKPGALDELAANRLGKTVLFTSRDDWSDDEIVLAYRGQHEVESAFRTMKDPAHVSFAPLHHWTDQKIRVHVLYCVLALLLASLLAREAERAGVHASIPALLDDLAAIQEVTTVFAPAGNRRKPRASTTLPRMTDRQRLLFTTFGLNGGRV